MEDTQVDSLEKLISDFLERLQEGRDVPDAAGELLEALRRARADLESLQRYRATRERIGRREPETIEPPNFPYTVHAA